MAGDLRERYACSFPGMPGIHLARGVVVGLRGLNSGARAVDRDGMDDFELDLPYWEAVVAELGRLEKENARLLAALVEDRHNGGS